MLHLPAVTACCVAWLARTRLPPVCRTSLAPVQVCPPAWFAASVVQHPVRLQHLLSSFLEAFAFEPSLAGMLLYSAAAPAPAGAATSFARQAGGTGGDGSSSNGKGAANAADGAGATGQLPVAEQALALPGGGTVALLPRMPLGLALLTTAATYEAVAAALRAVAAVAAAADAAPGSSGTTVRCLVDGCLSRLQQLAEAAGGSGSAGAPKRHRGRRQLEQQAWGSGAAAEQQAEAGGAGQVPWQLQAASVASVLSELLFGASPAWQPAWQPGGEAAAGSGGSSRELEALAAGVVQELVQESIWALPTSNLAASGDAGGPLELPAPRAAPALRAQQLGCNALLLKAALECCGAAARALGPRFTRNGRLLRIALLPMLDKLGGWVGGCGSTGPAVSLSRTAG